MRSVQWPRVSDLMHRALEVPEAERRSWVVAAAAGDAPLIAEAMRLLDAHGDAGGFLQRPLIAEEGVASVVDAALAARAGSRLGVGATLGHYRIIREIGHGGMGTVYLAVRADYVFDKQVAIKVVPGALVSETLRERFARERRLLATLDHPGIARVLDGGATDDGLQYLVMEYVEGVPLDAYCESRDLGLSARLQVFLEVCRAVQYAHGRLIIHRDIKASNVFVGADGRPRLLDFGIAKLLGPDSLNGETGATLVQAWTPDSASPEQVCGESTTIATDVYGLGALLYRLLAGRPIFDLHGLSPVERVRMISEAAPQAPSAAATRAGRTAGWAAAVRGDLDQIVIKALHKDPGRRYSSVERFGDDIERRLAGRPVLAAPDRWTYRARKFVARHPVSVAASVVAIVAILGASAAAVWQARRADHERQKAEARLADVRKLANTLIFDVYDKVENSPNATPIRQFLVQQGLEYLDRLSEGAGADPTQRVELARAYGRLADVQGARGGFNLGDRAGAARNFEKGRALLTPLLARQAPPLEAELTYLRLTQRLADTVGSADLARARQLATESVERARVVRDRHAASDEAIGALANAYFFAARFAGANEELDWWTEAARAYRALLDRAPEDPNRMRHVALVEKHVGAVHQTAKRRDLARSSYERALELDRRVYALRPGDRQAAIDLAIDLGNLASLIWEEGHSDLARVATLYEESLTLRETAAARDPQDVFGRQAVGFCLINLSEVMRQLGDFDRAIVYGRRAVAAYKALPASEQFVRRGLAWRAVARAAEASKRRPSEACAAYRRAHEELRKAGDSSGVERQLLDEKDLRSVTDALESCPRPSSLR